MKTNTAENTGSANTAEETFESILAAKATARAEEIKPSLETIAGAIGELLAVERGVVWLDTDGNIGHRASGELMDGEIELIGEGAHGNTDDRDGTPAEWAAACAEGIVEEFDPSELIEKLKEDQDLRDEAREAAGAVYSLTKDEEDSLKDQIAEAIFWAASENGPGQFVQETRILFHPRRREFASYVCGENASQTGGFEEERFINLVALAEFEGDGEDDVIGEVLFEKAKAALQEAEEQELYAAQA